MFNNHWYEILDYSTHTPNNPVIYHDHEKTSCVSETLLPPKMALANDLDLGTNSMCIDDMCLHTKFKPSN